MESETYLQAGSRPAPRRPATQAAFDEAFLEMAAQGQSGFIASGDQGAYTATVDLGTTNLSVDDLGRQPVHHRRGRHDAPVVRHAGRPRRHHGQRRRDEPADLGLGLPVAAARRDRRASRSRPPRSANIGGGGGGFARSSTGRSYQHDVPGTGQYHAVQYLTPTDYKTVEGTPTWSSRPSGASTRRRR